jgi:hypothetical protein
MLVRDGLQTAVRDRVIAENPARELKYRKRKTPIRLTPTFEEFKQIVAKIRAQKFNQIVEQSGDFVEFLGLAGLGAAEAASLYSGRCRFQSGPHHRLSPQNKHRIRCADLSAISGAAGKTVQGQGA